VLWTVFAIISPMGVSPRIEGNEEGHHCIRLRFGAEGGGSKVTRDAVEVNNHRR
jgi:hypothetical protein